MRFAIALITLALAASGCTLLPAGDVGALPDDAHSATAEQRFVVITMRNDPGHAPSHAASTARGYDSAAHYTAEPTAKATARRLARDHQLVAVAEWPIRLLDVHCVVYRLPLSTSLATALAALAKDPRVESAQPLTTFTTQAAQSNDPYRMLQHNLDALGVGAAHRWSRGGGVRVAVIDTGADVSHADLAADRIVARNFVDADEARFRADRHGTQVAGVIAAVANNALGIAGVAPEVMLYAFKACWHEDARAAARCNSFTLARALAAAIEAKVQQINMSLAGPHDPLLARLVEQALKRKIVIVAAAPPKGARGAFPAELSSVLAAAPLEDGPHDARIVVAPGQDIPTLVPNGGYDFASGSSIAAAEVSGVVALLLARNPQLDAAAIREILQTSRPRPLNAASSIDACRALAAVDPRDPCGPDQTALGAELH